MLGIGRHGPLIGPVSAPDQGQAPGTPGEAAAASTTASVTATDRGPDEAEAWAILASVSGLGPVTLAALLARAGSAGAIVAMADGDSGRRRLSETLAAAAEGLARDQETTGASAAATPARQRIHGGDALVARILEAVRGRAMLLGRIDDLGLGILTLDDPGYPRRLRAIEMPPPVLYVRGDAAALDALHAIAIVGTRRPSDAGRRVASRIAGAVARQGASVVSGLAIGIDGVAHAAAVAESAVTVAVLGGGHGRVYPQAHARLADAIVASGGAILAELPPDTEAVPGTFPRRNRLISGLADATVVVEAAARSGALITASWALEQGRGCFVVPGAIDAPASAGCLAFLREWAGEARIVAGVGELLEDLGLAGADAAPRGGGASTSSAAVRAGGSAAVLLELGSAEGAVAAALAAGRATVDDLVAVTSLPVATVLGTLTLLEMRGLAVGAYGRYLPAGRLATMPLDARRGRPAGAARGGEPALARFAASSGGVLP